jgi:hypothetical protein
MSGHDDATAAPVQTPAPFEIVRQPGAELASNGSALLMVHDGGRAFLRRGLRGVGVGLSTQAVLPLLNELAGRLVTEPETLPAAALSSRLAALAAMAAPREPERVEWAVGELNGVRAYFDGSHVILTTQDRHI